VLGRDGRAEGGFGGWSAVLFVRSASSGGG
jgi:hypothetical protein